MVPEKIELFSGLRLTNGDDGVYFFLMRFKNCEVNEVAVRGLKENLQKKIEFGLDKSKKSAKLRLTFSLGSDEWS